MWIQQTGTTKPWSCIACNASGDKLVGGLNQSSTHPWTSTDFGATWTERTGNSAGLYRTVTSDATGNIILAAGDAMYLQRSTNAGTTWSSLTGAGLRNWIDVVCNATGSVIMGLSNDGENMISTDSGSSWALSIFGSWYAGCSDSSGAKLAAVVRGGNIYTSTNAGSTWTTRTSAGVNPWVDIASSSDGLKLAACIGAGGDTGFIHTSADGGITWTVCSSSGNRNWKSIASNGDGTRLIAGLTSGKIYVSTNSGTAWSEITDISVRGWCVASGSSDFQAINAYNSNVWISPATVVYPLPLYDLYLGGRFTSNTSTLNALNHVTRWSTMGQAWSVFGTGFGNSFSEYIYAMTFYNNEWYVGGTFQAATGSPADFIAKWNGTAWVPVGSIGALNGAVRTMVVFQGELYVGGEYTLTSAGGTPVRSIAKWNGTAWSAVGDDSIFGNWPTPSTIYSMATDGTTLYVAGYIYNFNFAMWNGTTWTTYGATNIGNIYALALNGSDLYLGGDFTVGAVKCVAKYSGGTLTGVGAANELTLNYGGVSVNTLLYDSGTLYAGGVLLDGTGGANYLAKWNGVAWSKPATTNPSSGAVSALALVGGELIVAQAGGTLQHIVGGVLTDIGSVDGATLSSVYCILPVPRAAVTNGIYDDNLLQVAPHTATYYQYPAVGVNQLIARHITIAETGHLGKVRFMVGANGITSGKTFTAYIYSNTQTLLATSSVLTPGARAEGYILEFTFPSPATVTQGVDYYIGITSSDVSYGQSVAGCSSYIWYGAIPPVSPYSLNYPGPVLGYTINIIDTSAPTPGNSGIITAASVLGTSLTLNWTKSTDVDDAQNTLQYLAYYSLNSTLDSVANIESNGTAVGSYTTDINTVPVVGLISKTTYYFNVIVKDAAGNKAAYAKLTQATSDITTPTPGNSGTITPSLVTGTGLTLNWTKAADVDDAQNTLQYLAYYSTSTMGTTPWVTGTAVGSYATDINTKAVAGLTPGQTYYFNVAVKDAYGNVAAYTELSQQTTPPVAGINSEIMQRRLLPMNGCFLTQMNETVASSSKIDCLVVGLTSVIVTDKVSGSLT